ncbi:MAG: bifunctional 3-(3-hydroxy-phenyl)propionate/3-hydroxycinnamic acid hydroxylase [Steroidobacterales bacterium]
MGAISVPARRHAIVVVGSGPVGLTLANLLGCEGIDVLLVERNAATVTEPRAVSIDDEALRTMQAAGLIEPVLKEIVPGYGSHYFSPAGRCFIRVEPTETPNGYPRRNAFRQPVLERQLQEGLRRFPHVTCLYGWELSQVTPAADQVIAKIRGSTGQLLQIDCDFLIGCDGASSTVREQLGILMEGETFSERWLIVDLEESHNTTRHTKVFCDARRPCITLPGPHDTRRFEFKLFAHERDADMLAPRMIRQLLDTHEADPRAVIRRSVVYRFHARCAMRWSQGRVFLAGDAAHLTPPFAGQGFNSGVRDCHNLAWKLAMALRRQAGPQLLATYEQERRVHARAMIELALRMGRVMAPRNRLSGLLTRLCFYTLGVIPTARVYIAQMRYRPPPRFKQGFIIPAAARRPHPLVGRLFPQPLLRDLQGRNLRLDELIGNRFALLAWTEQPQRFFLASEHDIWRRLEAVRVAVVPERLAITPIDQQLIVKPTDSTLAQAFHGRSERAVLLRPDHYVAAEGSVDQLNAVAQQVSALLEQTWGSPSSL